MAKKVILLKEEVGYEIPKDSAEKTNKNKTQQKAVKKNTKK